MLDTAPFANYLGLFGLIFYILTLLPTILRIVFPATKKTELPKFLLKYRREIGVIAFLFALGHGVLLLSKRNFDIFDSQTYSIYATGVVTLIIFTLLAITSNNWSIKKMKKNWKKLHQLTYFAMFILVWHVIYTMWGHWSHITPLGVIGITGTTILFIARKLIEHNKKSAKIKAEN
ncbi:MAG: iron reductase [Okeania sp. SIO3B5]|uniref:ferric reductase-like transmembrane domain-containing protein n=1 Tax=Okeania sp. SIO3B5 TaxID=2607811 RepID=UPI0013FF69AD|nr:ferric reductase-like transmembrane domain-containing protein [Okeania sp. SIO3B5]NEO56106.1 iron reductase [Okeania sp. SIO3B5]